jgi:hypothetical protein
MKKSSIIIVGLVLLIIIGGWIVYNKISPILKAYKSIVNYNIPLPTNFNQALHQVENVANHLTSHNIKPDSSVNVPKSKSIISGVEYNTNSDLWVTTNGKKQRYSSVYPPFLIDSSGVRASRVSFELTTGLYYTRKADTLLGKLPSPSIMVDVKLPKKLRVNAQISTSGLDKIDNYTSLKKFAKSTTWGVFLGYRW